MVSSTPLLPLQASNSARSSLLVQGVPGLFKMLSGVAPTLGDYYKMNGSDKLKKL